MQADRHDNRVRGDTSILVIYTHGHLSLRKMEILSKTRRIKDAQSIDFVI